MPLDTSAYNLALLRVDGRRWNELRRIHAQIRTQAAADGSSYLEMGHTKVMCVVTGPSESGPRRVGTTGGAAAGGNMGGPLTGSGGAGGGTNEAEVLVSVVLAGFSSVDRKRRGRNDKSILELQSTISSALASTLHTHLYPHSTISVSLHVLSQDGSLLAALLNAASLACVDAGIPMTDYIAACTAGSTSTYAANDESADPLLDMNHQEEQELPGLTVATLGESDRVIVLVCESRVQVSRLEGMLAVGVDGCKQVRSIMDAVVREKGRRMLAEGTVEKGVGLEDMDLD
ncbi:3' exoribonuclease family, domain 1 domain containing protein [Naviculisporaceae sp. PSN 640]